MEPMSKRVPEQSEDEKQDAKKLSRREHRLQKRLEEAQERYESALARLQHAERRLQKRLERVERLNGRLAIVRQQLDASTDSQGKTPTDSTLKQDNVQLEIPSLPPEPANAASEIVDTKQTPVDASELHQEETVDQNVTFPDTDEPASKVIEPEDLLVSSLVAEISPVEPALDFEPAIEPTEPESVLEAVEEEVQQEEEVVQDIPEPISSSRRSQLISDARSVAEAAERAAQIATRRTNHILDHLEQMLDGRYLFQELEQLQAETATLSSLARDARKTVDAVLQVPSQAGSEDTIASLLQEVERQRQTLVHIRMNIDFPPEDNVSGGSSTEDVSLEDESRSLIDLDDDLLIIDVEETAFDLPSSLFTPDASEQETLSQPSEEIPDLTEERIPPFSLTTIERLAYADERITSDVQQEFRQPSPFSQNSGRMGRLDEEEKEVETVAAMVVANVAAAAAAEAEALAEALGVRTRNAYMTASQASQVLEQIRAAIRAGTLSGSEAQAALQLAERSVTEVQAALADAEAAEEHAVSAAINAEAEAEVAEGMALALHGLGELPLSTSFAAHQQSQELSNEVPVVRDPDVHLGANQLASGEKEVQAQSVSQQDFA
jgi:hypothetical protein